MFENYEDLLGVDGVCVALGICKSKAYSMMRNGELDAFQVGRTWKISKQSIVDYIERRSAEAAFQNRTKRRF